MGTLTLVRHTTPDIAPGVCYGRTDLDVSAQFEDEAAKAAVALISAPTQFVRIVSSPLRRCRKLADVLAERLELIVEEDPRLAEMDFGSWEGMAWSDISRAELDAWAADFLNARPHGGESVAMLRARALAALADWRTSGQTTLIVTHAGVIRAALATGDTAKHFNAKIAFGGFVTLPPEQGSTL
ncbi:MAG: alpha-ribazole phosphatase [Pseudomonadota bacterium]